jgi:uracil-DNA glycosylase family 4
MSVNLKTKIYKLAWRDHLLKWRGCERCPLHKSAMNKVLLRGDLPCDILFIGEAPDEIEDIVKEPFVGPAGKLLDKMIVDTGYEFSYAMTHVVACIAKGEVGELRPPSKHEVSSCEDRLYEVVQMAKPKGIVLLGTSSQGYSTGALERYKDSYERLHLSHPAQILRQGGEYSPFYKKELKNLTAFLEKVNKDEFG